jgi:hypothetical protein
MHALLSVKSDLVTFPHDTPCVSQEENKMPTEAKLSVFEKPNGILCFARCSLDTLENSYVGKIIVG